MIKKFLLAFGFLIGSALSAAAQDTFVALVHSNGPPTGACNIGFFDQDDTTGNLYTCPNSHAWTLIQGTGSGITNFFGNSPGTNLTVFADPTLLVDSGGNDISFTSTGLSWSDAVGDTCSGTTGTLNCHDGSGDFMSLSDGVVKFSSITGAMFEITGSEYLLKDGTAQTLSSTGGVVTVATMIDSALTPGTSPICPNGSGGVLVNTGCAAGGLSGQTPGQIPLAATATTSTSSIATTNTAYFPFQSLTTTGSSGNATLAAGVLNIPDYQTLPSGTLGLRLSNVNGLTLYAATSIAGGIDAKAYLTGSIGTCTLGTNDDVCIANAIAAIPGTPGTSAGYAIIDATGMANQIWLTNPFGSFLSNGSTNITSPAHCGELWLSGGSNIVMSEPLTVPRCWAVRVIGEFGQSANITASSSWPGVYTTGTVTNTAATMISSGQYQFTVTGIGTAFTNAMLFNEFGICQGTNNPGANGLACGGNGTTTCSSACGGNGVGLLTYGMIIAVNTGAQTLTVATANANAGAANGSGVNYVIKAPLIWLGAMGADGGDSGGASATWTGGTISCNNKPGCTAFTNFSQQENSSITHVVIDNVIDTYLDIEGINAVNSGPFDRMVMNASSSCTSATRAIITRIPGSLHPIENTTVNFDGCTSGAGEVAVDFEEGGDFGPGIHFEGNNTSTNIFVDVGENSGGVPLTACPVYCPQPVNIAAGAHLHDFAVTGTGQSAINIGSNGNTQIETENITASWTNVIADNARSCNITSATGDSTISRYDHLYGNGYFGTAQNIANSCGSGGTFPGIITFKGTTSGTATIGASASGSLLDLNGTNATVSAAGALTVTSCTGCGAGGPGTGTTNEVTYWSSSSALGSITEATTPNGVPQTIVEIPSGGALTAPQAALPGIVGRAVTGTTSTDVIGNGTGTVTSPGGSTDCNPNRIEYVGSVSVAVGLPTATALAVPNCVFKIVNYTTGSNTTVTVTPHTWTVNGNATLVLNQNQSAYFYVDPNSATNWQADVTAAGTVTSVTGSAPISSSGGTTPAISCATCVTSSGGGAMTGTAPIAVSGAGAISITGVAGEVLAGSGPAFTATPTLGASGTLGSLTFGNATSGLLTLQTATGAITSYTIDLPVAQPVGSNTFLSCTAASPAVCTWAAGGGGSGAASTVIPLAKTASYSLSSSDFQSATTTSIEAIQFTISSATVVSATLPSTAPVQVSSQNPCVRIDNAVSSYPYELRIITGGSTTLDGTAYTTANSVGVDPGKSVMICSNGTNYLVGGGTLTTFQTFWSQGNQQAGQAYGPTATGIYGSEITIPVATVFSHIYTNVDVADAVTTDLYSWGIYSTGGSALCSTTAHDLIATGPTSAAISACTQGTPVVIPPGTYIIWTTGEAVTATFFTSGTSFNGLSANTSSTTASGGQVPGTVTTPSAGTTVTPYSGINVLLQ